jgi:hypothetical protein
MKNTKILLGLILLTAADGFSARSDRTFEPSPGFTQAKDLPKDFRAVVDSVIYHIFDAFEGSKTHTEAEEIIFDIGNKLHIESSQRTIGRRLLFKKGSEVTREILLETERNLRKEQFLADAIIEVAFVGKNRVTALVTTYDQWTTVPAVGIQKPGDEWVYWFGPVESNLIGTGQKIGLYYGHDIDRNFYQAQYENKAFLINNLHLSGIIASLTDGYNYSYNLSKPLVSKTQKWGFLISGAGTKRSKYYYLDADDPGEAERRSEIASPRTSLLIFKDKGVTSAKLFTYKDVVDLNMSSSLTRSFGLKSKFLTSLTYTWQERYQKGNSYYDSSFQLDQGVDSYKLDYRNDHLLGIYLSYYQNEYKTVKNFRNLKWSEDIDVGFRISTGIAQNMKLLGAKNHDLRLNHTLVYINVWRSKHFLTSSVSASYFLGYSGEFEDGTISQFLEYQWKPIPSTSTFFSNRVNCFWGEKRD